MIQSKKRHPERVGRAIKQTRKNGMWRGRQTRRERGRKEPEESWSGIAVGSTEPDKKWKEGKSQIQHEVGGEDSCIIILFWQF